MTSITASAPMDENRRTSLIAGLLFLATFVTGIVAAMLYDPILGNADFILGHGAESRVTVGAVLEILLLGANIGTALVLYPILRKQSEVAALGWVAARIVECAFIAVGFVALLAMVTLRQDAPADPATLAAIGDSLIAIHDWTFRIGPGLVVGVGNGLLLGYLMYRSRLVPRGMAMLGLVGGPLLVLSGILVVLGTIDHGSTVKAVLAIPEIAWEASLTLYLIFKGFQPSPLLVE